MARAHWSFADRSAEIAALIPDSALGATANDAPSEIAVPIFRKLIEKARNPVELLVGLEGASAHRDHGSLSAILEKLRDTPYRIDAKVEALLLTLLGPDEIELVQREIDGGNPFRDRREALERVLASRARQ
ncbi:MAG: hypothetical protein U0169_10905 [Polyangiaceae bacterium]